MTEAGSEVVLSNWRGSDEPSRHGGARPGPTCSTWSPRPTTPRTGRTSWPRTAGTTCYLTGDDVREVPGRGGDPRARPSSARSACDGATSTVGPAGARRRGRLPLPPSHWGELALTVLLLIIGLVPGHRRQSDHHPGLHPTRSGRASFRTWSAASPSWWRCCSAYASCAGDRGPEEGGEDIDPDAPTSWRAVGIISVAFLAQALLINVVGWPLAVTSMFGGGGLVARRARASSGPCWPAASPRWSSGCCSSRPSGVAAAGRDPARARDETGS